MNNQVKLAFQKAGKTLTALEAIVYKPIAHDYNK